MSHETKLWRDDEIRHDWLRAAPLVEPQEPVRLLLCPECCMPSGELDGTVDGALHLTCHYRREEQRALVRAQRTKEAP